MKILLPILSVLLQCAISVAGAQSYPNKTVKLVIPYAPGGASDIVARQLAATMSTSMGQQMIVESRPGAAGNVAGEFVVRGPTDGYTLLLGNIGSHALNVSIYKKMPYDVMRDLEPISLVAGFPVVLVINPKLPVNNVRELVQFAKSKPAGLTYASGGPGSSQHLGAEWFREITGIEKFLHVPYKGDGPGMVAIMAGEVDLQFPIITAAVGHIKSGKLRALAVSSRTRSRTVPEVPTFVESGLPEFVYTSWVSLVGPAGVSKEIVQFLNREAVKAINSPELQARLVGVGAEPMSSTPEELRAFMKAEIEKWAPIIRRAGVESE